MKNTELYIYESGIQNPQSILFLHTSGASSKMWKKHIALFEDKFHCIAIDLPGHGNSRQTEWATFEKVADIIAEIIKSKSHGKVHAVGISLGGSLILKMLEKYPYLIDKAVIDGASAIPINGTWAIVAMVYLGSFFIKTKIVANLMTKMMTKSGVSEENSRLFIEDLSKTSPKSFRKAMIQACLLKLDLNNICFENPVFLVSGEKESKTMHDSHRILAQKNAHSRCAYYPNQNHAWIFSDFDTHIQMVKYFLQEDVFPDKLQMMN